jgi:hypothetical protein
MGRCGREVDGVHVSDVCFSVLRMGWTGCTRLVVAGWMFACVAGFMGTVLPAPAFACENERFRTGSSAGLPDCRAYELVTPANLGSTQDMTFTDNDHAIPSDDGERIALVARGTALEPNPGTSPNIEGTEAVFSRTPEGWTMRSTTPLGTAADRLSGHLLFSPDLSQVAWESSTRLNGEEFSPRTLEVGPVGGPYTLIAQNVPNNTGTTLAGANAGTGSVPALSDLLFSSTDHAILPPGTERAMAEDTLEGAPDLYDWTGGELRLVNVKGERPHIEALDQCGAELGEGFPGEAPGAVGAVSEDGSKIFFTSPEPAAIRFGATCEPPRLYMRVDGRETVEVSAPAPNVKLTPSERKAVYYAGATPDGSEVFFYTKTPLTGVTVEEEEEEEVKCECDHLPNKLFMYDTVTGALTLVASGAKVSEGVSRFFDVSENGSTVYYEKEVGPEIQNIYRYETESGDTSLIATAKSPPFYHEGSYTTPNGEFFVFAAYGSVHGSVREEGVVGEPRGAGHNELYRYDHASESVMCVSCGEGIAPGESKTSEMLEPEWNSVVERTGDELPRFIPMSDNGQEVFFQTTANLVPQDTNNTETIISSVSGALGMDVYEWEADGAEEAPGVFCRVVVGCTHLLSSGENVGPEYFLGASRDGRDVFFSSAAQLVPQATPEFTNIYDARVDGGFPPSPPPSECLSCQGVGSPPPLFNVPASGSFAGTGTSVASIPIQPQKNEEKGKKKKGKGKQKKRQQRQKRRRGDR